MSLLMDALRQAEAAKQQAAGEKTPLTLSLLPDEKTAPSSPLPDLASHLAELNADLAANAPTDTAPPPNSSISEAPPEFLTRPASPGILSRWQWPLAIGISTLLGLAIYFWWPSPATFRPPVPPERLPAPQAPPVMQQRPQEISPPALPSHSPASTEKPEAPPRPLASTPATEPPPLPDAPLPRFSITRSPPEASPALQSAWQHLRSGQNEEAARIYRQALTDDPRNTDALLGLASLAEKSGQIAEAEQLRQQALAANPKNATAQALFLTRLAESEPQTAESRLRLLLSEQKGAPPLHFALGNLLASQQRWAEAQQAFFTAVALQGNNPDYLFNLAVALDQLRQNASARQYYRQALLAAEQQAAAFSPAAAKRRLAELEAEADSR